MKRRPKGRYFWMDPQHPPGYGICDQSQFMFRHDDLVKQMEWRGNNLQWTGLMVGRPFLDEPNPQARPPILAPDPIPLENPRPNLNLSDIPPSPEVPMWMIASELLGQTNFHEPSPVENTPPATNSPSPSDGYILLNQTQFTRGGG